MPRSYTQLQGLLYKERKLPGSLRGQCSEHIVSRELIYHSCVYASFQYPLCVQATKLKHQLTYEKKRNLKKDVEAAQADLKKVQDNLERLQTQADSAAKATAALEDELSAEVSIPPEHPA